MSSKRYKKLPEKTKNLSSETLEKLLPELKKNYVEGAIAETLSVMRAKENQSSGSTGL